MIVVFFVRSCWLVVNLLEDLPCLHGFNQRFSFVSWTTCNKSRHYWKLRKRSHKLIQRGWITRWLRWLRTSRVGTVSHITCSQQQNITFNDWSFREIPQFLGMAGDEKEGQNHGVGDVLAADEPCWPPETSFSYLGCFVFNLAQDGALPKWLRSCSEMIFHRTSPQSCSTEMGVSIQYIVWFFRTSAW